MFDHSFSQIMIIRYYVGGFGACGNIFDAVGPRLKLVDGIKVVVALVTRDLRIV